MLDDQIVEPTDYNPLDKALQGGFRQGDFSVIFGRPRRRAFPLDLDAPMGEAFRKYHNQTPDLERPDSRSRL